ncbi:hypothetical protein BDV33DRAFT_185160 [Aspergillus novoparasiticus]|uniref:Uncharacterized protein n=1 Tax=Aspergillus novoparasiticus TaxID=986946 RepID=A0A5N6E8Z5_9EURO|nr:hypothetical protein BDV33DRAFT_185160 [Aspergillus novoparasiticus]
MSQFVQCSLILLMSSILNFASGPSHPSGCPLQQPHNLDPISLPTIVATAQLMSWLFWTWGGA